MHIAKCLYGILQDREYKQKMSRLKTLEQKVNFISAAYIKGTQAYEDDMQAQEEIKDINYLVYAAAQRFSEKESKIKKGSTDYLQFVKADKSRLKDIYDLWVIT